MKERCPVCRGRKYIRLPLYHQLSAAIFNPDAEPLLMQESSRHYDCPECSDKFGISRMYCASDIQHKPDVVHVDAVKESIAHTIADRLLRDGFIEFETGKPDYKGTPIRGIVMVAHPSERVKLETRVTEHQEQIAETAASIACADIRNWGSLNNYTSIHKDIACEAVRNAVKGAIAKYKEWKKL